MKSHLAIIQCTQCSNSAAAATEPLKYGNYRPCLCPENTKLSHLSETQCMASGYSDDHLILIQLSVKNRLTYCFTDL